MSDPNDLTLRENMLALILTLGANAEIGEFMTGNEPWQLGIDNIDCMILADSENIKDTIDSIKNPPQKKNTDSQGAVTYTDQKIGTPTPQFRQLLRGFYALSAYYKTIGFSAADMTRSMFAVGIISLFITDRDALKKLLEKEVKDIPQCPANAHANRGLLIAWLRLVETWAMCNFTTMPNMAPFSIYSRDD